MQLLWPNELIYDGQNCVGDPLNIKILSDLGCQSESYYYYQPASLYESYTWSPVTLNTPDSSGGDGGAALSVGAIAGIVVAVVAVLGGVAALVYVFLFLRKNEPMAQKLELEMRS